MALNVPKFVVIHTTDYSYRLLSDQFLACNGWHKDRDFPLSSLNYYIGYHRLITGDKNYQARFDTEIGAHCNQQENGLSVNFQSLGIAVGFDGDIEQMTGIQYDLLQKQVWEWQDQYLIPNENVRFHRYWARDKTCPGSLITQQWLKDLLVRPLPAQTIKPESLTCLAKIEELETKVGWFERLTGWKITKK